MSRVAVGRVPRRELCLHIHWGRIQERRRWHSLLNVRRDTIRSVSRTYVPVIVHRVVRRRRYYGNICASPSVTAPPAAANITCTHVGTNKCGLYKTIGARAWRLSPRYVYNSDKLRGRCASGVECLCLLVPFSKLLGWCLELLGLILSHKVSAPRALWRGGVISRLLLVKNAPRPLVLCKTCWTVDTISALKVESVTITVGSAILIKILRPRVRKFGRWLDLDDEDRRVPKAEGRI